ncbi:MAG: glycosyltransferase [Gemmatimonadaceae bacterium]
MTHRPSFVITARNEDPDILAATVRCVAESVGNGWREIVVVDDASARPVANLSRDVTLLRNDVAVGTSRARRQGAAATSGDVLTWLDAHMTFGDGWLDAMLSMVDSGALLCPPWRGYDRATIHCWGADFVWGEQRDHLRGRRPGFDFAHRLRPPNSRNHRVPMIISGCYMMRRDAYDRTAGFCPLFKIYGGDEPDMAARAWLSGGEVRCVPNASVGHLDRTGFPYIVSFDDVEFNQIVMIRSNFDEPTARVLEEFFEPLSDTVRQWLRDADIGAWRSEVQARRRMSDAEFFRRIAPRVPLSFARGVRPRRGHLPACEIRRGLDAEEAALAKGEGENAWRERVPVVPVAHRLVHAGVAAYDGCAILLPGVTSAGRRALLAALVRAGATIYSSTFAELDESGYVHPHPAVDNDDRLPLPVGIIASIGYTGAGKSWRLKPVSQAEGALELLACAAGGRDQTIFVAVNRAVESSQTFRGRRGPAGPLARGLMSSLMASADAERRKEPELRAAH